MKKETIFDKIVKARNGHYCHCIEVSDVYELEIIAEAIIQEFEEDHTEKEIIDFLESLEVYSLDDANEKQIFAFSFTEFIEGTI